MKFTVTPGELKTAFAAVKMALSSKNSMPVLDNILVETTDEENVLKMTASDGDNTIIAKMKIEEQEAMASVLVPADYLGNFVSGALNEWPVTFEFADNRLVISDLLGEFETGCNMDVSDYPVLKEMPEPVTIAVPAAGFIETTALAMTYTSNDTMRPVMNGVNYEFSNEGLRVGASDQKRMYMDTLPDIKVAEPVSVTMTKKIVGCVASLLSAGSDENLQVTIGGNMVRIERNNITIVGRLLEGKYPRLTSVIPKNNDRIATIDRDSLVNMIKRALVSSDASSRRIVMTFDGDKNVKIETRDVDFGRFASVNCETVSQSNIASPLRIGFRGNFMLDTLSSFKGCQNVVMMMNEPFRAVVIKSDPDAMRLSLIMPMQVADI